jgi:hypothetical protein
MISIVYWNELTSAAWMVKVKVPSEAGTAKHDIRTAASWSSKNPLLTPKNDTRVRGNVASRLLELDGHITAGWVGPHNSRGLTCNHLEGALTFWNTNGIVQAILRQCERGEERSGCAVEESHAG